MESTLKSLSFCPVCVKPDKNNLNKIYDEFDDEQYKIIVVNCCLAGVNSLEYIKCLKENDVELPLLLLINSCGNDKIIDYATKNGLENHLILKPFTPLLLLDKIMSILGNKVDAKKIDNNLKKWDIKYPASISGAKILLVEDNEINQQVAQDLLLGAGVLVAIAKNGIEAIEMNRKEHFDLILMDLQMPEMDGYQASSIIKTDYPSVPIVAMTANAFEDDRKRCLEAGMDDHVSKPVDPERLYQTLEKWLPEIKINYKYEDIESCESLPGVNINIGLRRLQGNKKLYFKLLKQFCYKHCNDAQKIVELIDKGDFDAAQRIAHTIKSIAGTVGAIELFNAAQDIELAAKNRQKAIVNDELVNFRLALDIVIDGIQNLKTKEETSTSPIDSFSYDSLSIVVKELDVLLRERDSEAGEKAELLLKMLSESCYVDLASEIYELANDYEYDDAFGLLNSLMEKMEMDI